MMLTVAFVKAIFSLNVKIILSLVDTFVPGLAPLLRRKSSELEEQARSWLNPVAAQARSCVIR
jgi:hypothetical protein